MPGTYPASGKNWSYSYDPNGNMTTRTENGQYTQTFNAENRLQEVRKNGVVVATFFYDGDGNRVKKVEGSVITYYVGGYYEKQGSTVTKYYTFAGQRVAMRKGGTLTYLHGDHLGSTSLATHGTTGGLVSRVLYYPYGETRHTEGTLPTDFRYTGQRQEGFGLYDYVARFYDPLLGRFVSADTIVPNPSDPQDLNRYSYVRNSPVRYTDPSGHCALFQYGACGGGDDKNLPPELPGSRQAATVVRRIQQGAARTTLLPRQAPAEMPEPDTGPITKFIQQSVPGTAEEWGTVATGLDTTALVFDAFSAGVVTFGGIAGAGIPAVLLPEGIPEVPVVTGLGGMAIAELYVQPAIQTANFIATVSTLATAMADVKAGHTRIEQGIVGANTMNSLTTTAIGWIVPEAYISTGLQALAVANDLGWTSIPFPQ